MEQIIIETNRALQRYHAAKDDAEAAAAERELVERHLPAFDQFDGEHASYGVEMRATFQWMQAERAKARRIAARTRV